MVAKKTWTLVLKPDRRLALRIREQVREVAMLRTLVDLQCNRYAIARETRLVEGPDHVEVEWPWMSGCTPQRDV